MSKGTKTAKTTDSDYSLLTYDSIKNIQKMIKSKILGQGRITEIILNSDLYAYLNMYDNRYIEVFGNPEFDVLKEYREDLKAIASSRILTFIYQTLKKGFSIPAAKSTRQNDIPETASIKSFFLKNFKGLLIRDCLLPISQYEYPIATAYTQELLTLFHRSAGYDRKISKYTIEDIQHHINASYNSKREDDENKKSKTISLKTAYTVWNAYTKYGETPKFKTEYARSKVIKMLWEDCNKNVHFKTAARETEIISADLDYVTIDNIAKEKFESKDYEFFKWWFDKTYFTNDTMSYAHVLQSNPTLKAEIDSFGIDSSKWSPVQTKINDQRITLICELKDLNLIREESRNTISAYTKRLLNSMESYEKNIYEKNMFEVEDTCNSNILSFESKKKELEERLTLKDNLFFDITLTNSDVVKTNAPATVVNFA